jgi:hypothetical protein
MFSERMALFAFCEESLQIVVWTLNGALTPLGFYIVKALERHPLPG